MLEISEYYKGKESLGGSSLTVTIIGGSSIDYCPVHDHFNGR